MHWNLKITLKQWTLKDPPQGGFSIKHDNSHLRRALRVLRKREQKAKTRDIISIEKDLTEKEITKKIITDSKAKKYVENKKVKKTTYEKYIELAYKKND